MSEDKNLAFPIPNSVLEPYIKQAVSAAIMGALGNSERLVAGAVQNVLSMKVNHQGVVSNYNSENTQQLCEVLARNKIMEITKATINEMAEAMRPKIKTEIETQLKTKHKALAQALVDGMIGSLATSWNIRVEFKPTN